MWLSVLLFSNVLYRGYHADHLARFLLFSSWLGLTSLQANIYKGSLSRSILLINHQLSQHFRTFPTNPTKPTYPLQWTLSPPTPTDPSTRNGNEDSPPPSVVSSPTLLLTRSGNEDSPLPSVVSLPTLLLTRSGNEDSLLPSVVSSPKPVSLVLLSTSSQLITP
jgi:hypothetical protein